MPPAVSELLSVAAVVVPVVDSIVVTRLDRAADAAVEPLVDAIALVDSASDDVLVVPVVERAFDIDAAALALADDVSALDDARPVALALAVVLAPSVDDRAVVDVVGIDVVVSLPP